MNWKIAYDEVKTMLIILGYNIDELHGTTTQGFLFFFRKFETFEIIAKNGVKDLQLRFRIRKGKFEKLDIVENIKIEYKFTQTLIYSGKIDILTIKKLDSLTSEVSNYLTLEPKVITL